MSLVSRNKVAGLVLFTIFVVCMLLVLVVGVKIYASAAAAEDASNLQRFSSGVLENSVRACDEAGSVAKVKGPEGNALVLKQTTDAGVFETRFYLFQGMLVQEYVPAGTPFSPDTATDIAKTSTFEFTNTAGLLTVTTDEGTTIIALRSSGTTSPTQQGVNDAA